MKINVNKKQNERKEQDKIFILRNRKIRKDFKFETDLTRLDIFALRNILFKCSM